MKRHKKLAQPQQYYLTPHTKLTPNRRYSQLSKLEMKVMKEMYAVLGMCTCLEKFSILKKNFNFEDRHGSFGSMPELP